MEEEKPKLQNETKKPARYVSTLDGSQWSVVKYGVVEFLRAHKFWRAIVAILGVLIPVTCLASIAGVKIPGISGLGIYLIFTFTCPGLIWAAVVSGPDFELTFPSKDAAKERQLAQEKFNETNAPEDALDLDLKRLNEYYRINQDQARSTFRWTIFTMFLGFTTIVAGVWLFYFGKPTPDTFMASLSTAAGIVVQCISGLFLHLHSKTQNRSLYYYDQLARLQRISIAIRLTQGHQDPNEQKVARNLLIREIMASARERRDGTDMLPNDTTKLGGPTS